MAGQLLIISMLLSVMLIGAGIVIGLLGMILEVLKEIRAKGGADDA